MSRAMHVSPKTMRQQLTFVSEKYEVIPLREYVRRATERKSVADCVAITFDDAYAGITTEGLEVLRDLSLPATVFVPSKAAAKGSDFWWDRFHLIVESPSPEPWQEILRDCGLPQMNRGDASDVQAVRDHLLAANAGRPSLPGERPLTRPWRCATFDELRMMAEWDGIDFGVHTVTHPVLPLLSPSEQAEEIARCYECLQDELPRTYALLAYPYGYFDRTTMGAAAAAGMYAAFSAEGFPPPRRTHPFALPRIGMSESRSVRSLRGRLTRVARILMLLRVGRAVGRIPKMVQ